MSLLPQAPPPTPRSPTPRHRQVLDAEAADERALHHEKELSASEKRAQILELLRSNRRYATQVLPMTNPSPKSSPRPPHAPPKLSRSASAAKMLQAKKQGLFENAVASARSVGSSTAAPSQASARSSKSSSGASPQVTGRSSATPPNSGRLRKPPICGTRPRSGCSRAPERLASLGNALSISSSSIPVVRSGPAGRSSVSARSLGGRALQAAVSPDPRLPERLAEAARCHDAAAIQACLQAGARASGRDQHGWAPLHYSAADGHLEICRMLLETGCDVDVQLPDLSTPLMLAAEEGHMAIAELLLQRGARPWCKDETGFTALDRCAEGAVQEFKRLVQECQ
mmetsp:Transcript_28212/g.49272  ORF Transcript_28212/g.49272 Transcript_28212/m.49272 type:complete len:341 (+) Transcript_28212:137-1159(+)